MKTLLSKPIPSLLLLVAVLSVLNSNIVQNVQAQGPLCITKQITNDIDYWDAFPSIDGDHIAWTRTNKNGMMPEIYMYDIDAGESHKILTLQDVTFAAPILHGDYIGIIKGTNEDSELYLYQVSTKQLTQLTSSSSQDGAMSIDDRYVLWGSKTKDENQIFLYDLKTRVVKPISPIGINRLGYPAPSLDKDYVAWKLHDGQHDEFFIHHIPSSTTTQLTDNSELYPNSNWAGNEPILKGNYLQYIGFDDQDYFYHIGTQSYVDLPIEPTSEFTDQYVLGYDGEIDWYNIYDLSIKKLISVPKIEGTQVLGSQLSNSWLILNLDYDLSAQVTHPDLAIFDLNSQSLKRLTNDSQNERVVVTDKYIVWTVGNPNAEQGDDGDRLTDLFLYYCPTSPSISALTSSHVIPSNTSTVLHINASIDYGIGNYQWYQGEVNDISNPVGFNSPAFTTPLLTQNTSYWVRVSNEYGSVDSTLATVRVAPANFALPDTMNNLIIRDPSTLNAFHWGASTNVDTYTLSLMNISSNTRLGEIISLTINSSENCSVTECSTFVQIPDLQDGLYSWTVVAHNPSGDTEAMNSPFFFTLDTGPVELIKNGGFESELSNWTFKNPSGDGVKCNQDEKIIAYTGNCAYQTKGGVGEKSSLKQTLSSENILQGDTLALEAQINQKSGLAGQNVVIVKLTYADSTTDKLELSLPQVKEEGFSLFTDVVTVGKPLTGKIKVQVRYRGISGSLVIDDIRLTVDQTTSLTSDHSLLSLP